jgi:hypothetical protein
MSDGGLKELGCGCRRYVTVRSREADASVVVEGYEQVFLACLFCGGRVPWQTFVHPVDTVVPRNVDNDAFAGTVISFVDAADQLVWSDEPMRGMRVIIHCSEGMQCFRVVASSRQQA